MAANQGNQGTDDDGGEQAQQGRTPSQQEGRGFAGMDPDRQREIAAEGGREAHDFSAQQGGQQSQDGASQGRLADSERGNDQQSQRDDACDQQDGRGFAGMDPDRQRKIASEGGRAAHESGNAHKFDSEEARQAGSHSHDNDSH